SLYQLSKLKINTNKSSFIQKSKMVGDNSIIEYFLRENNLPPSE
ncbi:hypothetical protein M153_294900001, partial [Pseudoloma neurophilia]